LRELISQREELSDQLANVSSRRGTLAEEMRTTPDGVTRAGLEDRLRLLDQRILQLETDLSTTGRQIAMAPAELVEGAYSRDEGDDGFLEGMMFTSGFMLIGGLIVYFFVRRRWRRRTKGIPSQSGADSAQRLERLEQGMDAIALEIERISEGQRFVTKLLSESQAPLAAPHRIAVGSAPVEREDPAKR
jgi:hypothetical protein